MEQYHDPISERIQPSMTFGAWLDLWYQNDSRPKLRKTTQQHYENLIYHHLIPSVGDIPLDQLTLGDLQQFFKRMKDCGRLTHTEQRGAGLSDPHCAQLSCSVPDGPGQGGGGTAHL